MSYAVKSAADLASREIYERGGWKDGRMGQVYDLLWAVLEERGEKAFRHPLLTQIETMDEADEA